MRAVSAIHNTAVLLLLSQYLSCWHRPSWTCVRKHFFLLFHGEILPVLKYLGYTLLLFVDAGKPCSQWINRCLTFEVREKLNRSAVEQNKDKCHGPEGVGRIILGWKIISRELEDSHQYSFNIFFSTAERPNCFIRRLPAFVLYIWELKLTWMIPFKNSQSSFLHFLAE